MASLCPPEAYYAMQINSYLRFYSGKRNYTCKRKVCLHKMDDAVLYALGYVILQWMLVGLLFRRTERFSEALAISLCTFRSATEEGLSPPTEVYWIVLLFLGNLALVEDQTLWRGIYS